MTASCLCKYGEGAGFPFQVESLEMGMIRSTLSTFTKQTMGRVRRRTSTKQCSITLVVRNLRRRWGTKAKNDDRQVLRQAPYHAGEGPPPARLESTEGGFGSCPALGQIDGLGSCSEKEPPTRLYPNIPLRGGDLYENKRNGLGWEMGIEPTTSGATVRCSAS